MGTGIRDYSNPLYDTLAGETERKIGGGRRIPTRVEDTRSI